MKPNAPPSFLHSLLLAMLPPRDRQTVPGDLHEEFLEVKLPLLGPFRARLWYLRQVVSFAPARAAALFLGGSPLRLLASFTLLSGLWLGMMDILLAHPGYVGHLYISGIIVTQGILTLAALRFRRSSFLRGITLLGGLPILWLASTALRAAVHGDHIEGYILLIALALIGQAVLTSLTLLRPAGPTSPSPAARRTVP